VIVQVIRQLLRQAPDANIGPQFHQSFRQPNSSMFMTVDS
ncbi:5610_t:CDS:1, partial [Funneliformis geosporum]